jgi:hypothetical protein
VKLNETKANFGKVSCSLLANSVCDLRSLTAIGACAKSGVGYLILCESHLVAAGHDCRASAQRREPPDLTSQRATKPQRNEGPAKDQIGLNYM